MREQYRNIARVMRTRGKAGEVVVISTDGLPALVYEGLEVSVVPPALKEPRRRRVESCRDADDSQVVLLEGCSSIDDAEALKGRYLLARLSDLPEGLALVDTTHLVGREVEDAALGPLGTIEDIMFGPTQATWVVNGPFGEVLIPAVKEIVGSVSEDGPITVVLPAGLVGGAS